MQNSNAPCKGGVHTVQNTSARTAKSECTVCKNQMHALQNDVAETDRQNEKTGRSKVPVFPLNTDFDSMNASKTR